MISGRDEREAVCERGITVTKPQILAGVNQANMPTNFNEYYSDTRKLVTLCLTKLPPADIAGKNIVLSHK